MIATVTPFDPARRKSLAAELYAPVLLVPGEYELLYESHTVGKQFKRGVLTVYFRAVEFDDTVIARYYNVIVTGSGKRNSFRPSTHSALVREFRCLFTQRIGRLDRFPLHWLKDQAVIGEVGTVTHDYEQNLLEESAEYSVIRRLLRCV